MPAPAGVMVSLALAIRHPPRWCSLSGGLVGFHHVPQPSEHSDHAALDVDRLPADPAFRSSAPGSVIERLTRWAVGPHGRQLFQMRWLLLLLSVSMVIPLWQVPWPPLQDLPQHLATMRVLHDYDNGNFAFQRYYTIEWWRTQYLAYYVLCDLLAYVFDVRLSNLLVLSAALVALPLTLGQWLQALGRDRAWALLALPLTYNAHLILGFLNFIAALPLMCGGLALAVRQCQQFSRRRAWLIAGILVLCFFTHVVPFALLALGILLLGVRWPAGKQVLRLLLPLAPSVPPLLLWLWLSPAGRSTAKATGLSAGAVKATFRPLGVATEQLPIWLTDIYTGDQDLWLLKLTTAAFCCALTVGVVLRTKVPVNIEQQRAGRRLLWLPLVAAAGYLFGPSEYDWIWPIAERFALLTLLLTIPLLPALSGPPRWVVVAFSALLSLSHLSLTSAAFAGFAKEVGDIEGAIAAIPPRSRVAGLIFQRGSQHVRFSPFLHYVSLYQLQRGGVTMFSFADFPQSPVAFRPEERPPRVGKRWEWQPQRVRPARDLQYYDYVLVRGGPGMIGRQRRGFSRVFHRGPWRVYRRNADVLHRRIPDTRTGADRDDGRRRRGTSGRRRPSRQR